MVLRTEYDHEADAVYVDLPIAHGRSLDDGRAVDYAADWTPVGVEILGPKNHGVDLTGIPDAAAVGRALEAYGFKILV